MNYPKMLLGWLGIQLYTWFIAGRFVHVTMRDLVMMLVGSLLWVLIALSWKEQAEAPPKGRTCTNCGAYYTANEGPVKCVVCKHPM